VSENRKFSVLMSVYIKENPTFLEEAVESILHQTLKPSEVVIVEDGPLTPEHSQVFQSNVVHWSKTVVWAWHYSMVFCSVSMMSLPVWIRMILLLKIVSSNSLT